jgi:hypothetical protein
MSKHHGQKAKSNVKKSKEILGQMHAHQHDKALHHAQLLEQNPLLQIPHAADKGATAQDYYTSSLHSQQERQSSAANDKGQNDKGQNDSPAQQASDLEQNETENSVMPGFNMLGMMQPWVELQQNMWMMMFQGWISILSTSPKIFTTKTGTGLQDE